MLIGLLNFWGKILPLARFDLEQDESGNPTRATKGDQQGWQEVPIGLVKTPNTASIGYLLKLPKSFSGVL